MARGNQLNQQLLLSLYRSKLQPPSLQAKIRATTTTSEPIGFPCVLRTSPDGADIPPDVTSAPVAPVADTDYTLWGLWHDTHGIEKEQLVYIVTSGAGVPSSAGPSLPTTGVDDDAYGSEPWVNPVGICDGSCAWVTGKVDAHTHYVKGGGFGFAIPTGAAVTGIALQVSRKADIDDQWGDYVVDERVRLTKAGVVQATDKADTETHWPTSYQARTYGGPGDLWGTTWTPAEINAAGFGAVLSAHVLGYSLYPGNGCLVWFYKITVYYTLAGSGQAAITKWHHNSLTDGYADGKAQYKSGTWIDQLYDHWFRAYEAETRFRCALTVSERTPIEQIAETLLRTCNGRIGWWDGKYHVSLDSEAVIAGTLSDKASDDPDLLIVGNSLKVGRSEAEVANVGVGTYFDVQTWTKPEARYSAGEVLDGSAQEKILRQDAAVPSGGQLYRLLGTWIKRCARTWRASCVVAQKGIRFAPGDVLTLSCSLFTGTKTVIIDDMRDAPGGTFELSLLEWAASDFLEEPYIAQAVVATTTTT